MELSPRLEVEPVAMPAEIAICVEEVNRLRAPRDGPSAVRPLDAGGVAPKMLSGIGASGVPKFLVGGTCRLVQRVTR